MLLCSLSCCSSCWCLFLFPLGSSKWVSSFKSLDWIGLKLLYSIELSFWWSISRVCRNLVLFLKIISSSPLFNCFRFEHSWCIGKMLISSQATDKSECAKHPFHHCVSMEYYNRLLLSLLLVLGGHIYRMEALLCAKNCWVGPVKLGSKDPFPVPCNIIEVDPTTTECTVALAMRLSESRVLGVIDAKPRATNMSATLKVFLDFNAHSTVSMVNYSCTTNDNCDQEFAREVISSSGWNQLNETKTRSEITSLLFDPSFIPRNFSCANNISCRGFYENCEAELILKSSTPNVNTTVFANDFKCIINHATEVGVYHYYQTPEEDLSAVITVFCNRDQCNRRETVDQVYNIVQNEYILPLNYTGFIRKMTRSPQWTYLLLNASEINVAL